MSLIITMLKAPASVSLAEAPLSINEQGGTLGRGNENSWVLEDPELYLSTLHCQFSFENGQYFLTDHSTNGSFYGSSVDPMGKGTKIPVHDNDRFSIGDYEFSISIGIQSALSANPFADQSGGPALPADDVFPTPVSADGLDNYASDPFAGGHVSSRESLFSKEASDSDPLAALDKARGGAADSPLVNPIAGHDPFAAPTHSDGANSLNQQIDWPQPVAPENSSNAAIPDDWDDDTSTPQPAIPQPASNPSRPLTEPPAKSQNVPQASGALSPEMRSRQQGLEQANVKIQAELDQIKQQVNSGQQAVNAQNVVDTTFINAMGFGNRNLSDEEISQINQLAGKVFREMVSGLMQVLSSRNSIKSEFRMNVTTIQPVENNPLKFSANVDDALENMFLKQGNAFKKPIESVRDGFEGVAEHQVAILAGIREAFKVVIGRFDPALLEESFSKQNKGGLLPGSQKAKNWQSYVDYYQELSGDIDKSFQYLFGDGFVRAYEDQLQKLAVTRKSRKIDKNE